MKNIFLLFILLNLSFACINKQKITENQLENATTISKKEVVLKPKKFNQQSLQRVIFSLKEKGGTIFLPKGDIIINGSLKLYGGIQLVGMGIDDTQFIRGNYYPNDSKKAIIEGNGSNGKSIIIRNIGFKGYEVENNDFKDSGIKLNNSKNYIISNCDFNNFGNCGIGINNDSYGVIFECNFDKIFKENINNLGYGVCVYGDGVWNDSISLGSKYATFVEDCTFSGCRHVIASNRAARYVFRNNYILEHPISHTVDAHGPGFGSKVGTQWVEIYNNIIENNLVNRDAIMIRGGSGVIYDNTIINHRHAIHLTLDFDERLDWQADYPLEWQVQNIWCWGNTLEGLEAKVFVPERSTVYIQEGRDFFIEEKPDYKAYPYPHPLRNIVLEE